MAIASNPYFATIGMFIVDEFSFADENGEPTAQVVPPQIGGGGTYAAIGARIWLPPDEIKMIIDKGHDFPADIESQLLQYGKDMWSFREQPGHGTTRALNSYKGELRNFEYLTPRIRITPNDLLRLKIKPKTLHFICSPTRAGEIVSEVQQVEGWTPTTIYEPIPDRCVPEELPALKRILPYISILSPNAEEALSLLGMKVPLTRENVEQAVDAFLSFGIGNANEGFIIVRSGALGAYVKSKSESGRWIDAYWGEDNRERVVDVTGAGNAFLGGLAAGLLRTGDQIFEAVLHASVSASFVIEQQGLPMMSVDTPTKKATWNGEDPEQRLINLRNRQTKLQSE
ncbi:Ribokinase-like protein [Coprinopsis marcescibilis]|uniref:Ribokinase-like protein n=1 Tax=Coprinopsis marcescibilis TaxID=230819 RepID=A0A5C3L263_COPMA|nr:Ribokinase-like protein [Coprinopsis marcescibilis]